MPNATASPHDARSPRAMFAICLACLATAAAAQATPEPGSAPGADPVVESSTPAGDAANEGARVGDGESGAPGPEGMGAEAAAEGEPASDEDPTRVAVEPKPTLVVLDFDAQGATELEAEAATSGAARGLRELDVFQVLTAYDVRQLLAIERTRQLLGGDSVMDLAQLSDSLGARHAVAGSVRRLDDQLEVELRLLDTRENQVISSGRVGPYEGIERLATEVPAFAQTLVAPLLKAQQGGILVDVDEEAAEVLVDDVLIATTPMEAAVPLARGAHRVQVRKDGFIAQARTVRIRPSENTVEGFKLLPSPDYARAYRERHGRLRVGAWIASGVAVAGLAGALVLDRAVVDPTYTGEFLPRRLALEGVPPSALRASYREDPAFMARYEQCGLDVARCIPVADELSGRVFALQVTTIGLAVVGAGATLAASYLWLSGRDPDRYASAVASISPLVDGGLAFSLSGSF